MSRIAFMHVPKTAGTSVISSLIDATRPTSCVRGFDRVLYGSFHEFHTLSEEVRRHIYMLPDELPAGADFIAGHFALSTLLHRYEGARLVTVLREPMSRLLSHWTFWRSDLGDGISRLGAWAAYRQLGSHKFVDFLSSPLIACQTDNLTVRMLLWPHPLIPDADFIPMDHDDILVTEALRRLEQFSHVNVTENPSLDADLSKWLARTVRLSVVKETEHVARRLSIRLEDELTAAACHVWLRRARLDRLLWLSVAAKVMPGGDLTDLEQGARMRSVARYGRLLLGPISAAPSEGS